MTKRKKAEEFPVQVSTSRSVTFDLQLMFWDQLVKAAEMILEHRDNGIPAAADVTFQGERICVDWDEDA